MTDTANKITGPAINDQYWFDFSKKLLDSSFERRDKAADTLQKLVIWLWGIYTTYTAVGFTLSGKQLDFWPTVIIAGASGFLILVYWGTTWVQMPDLVKFDPRSPTEIEDEFSRIILLKSKRLKLTIALSVIAAIMVSVAIIVASISKPVLSADSTLLTSFETSQNNTTVSITANVGKIDAAELNIISFAQNMIPPKDTVNLRLIPTSGGLIQTSEKLDQIADSVEVIVKFKNKEGVSTQYSRLVKKKS